MGRELTIFQGEADYGNLTAGLKENRVEQTIEFFPEEGKYHLTGHRKCGISQTPDETVRSGTRCSECGRPLTLGVLHRVEELADGGTSSDQRTRRPYTKLAPLIELLAHTMGKGRTAKSVGLAYHRICDELGGEINVLTQAAYADLERVGGEDLAIAVTKVRDGKVVIVPGFDGQYGTVHPAG
jgi:PHP family Zn ribbon phosphoesterase